MSNHQKKQQVRPETKIRKVGDISQGLGGVASKTTGLVGFFATADLPADAPDGSLAYDTATSNLKVSVSGSWLDA
jgi:hypothetical protein